MSQLIIFYFADSAIRLEFFLDDGIWEVIYREPDSRLKINVNDFLDMHESENIEGGNIFHNKASKR